MVNDRTGSGTTGKSHFSSWHTIENHSLALELIRSGFWEPIIIRHSDYASNHVAGDRDINGSACLDTWWKHDRPGHDQGGDNDFTNLQQMRVPWFGASRGSFVAIPPSQHIAMILVNNLFIL